MIDTVMIGDTRILIGICCFVIIISIICGFIAGKFYEMKKKKDHRTKHSEIAYDIVEESEDQV